MKEEKKLKLVKNLGGEQKEAVARAPVQGGDAVRHIARVENGVAGNTIGRDESTGQGKDGFSSTVILMDIKKTNKQGGR